jgi:ADP-ribosylglycohydrolase
MNVDAEILSRAEGCLLGQLAGDSLGGLVEFKHFQRFIARTQMEFEN